MSVRRSHRIQTHRDVSIVLLFISIRFWTHAHVENAVLRSSLLDNVRRKQKERSGGIREYTFKGPSESNFCVIRMMIRFVYA